MKDAHGIGRYREEADADLLRAGLGADGIDIVVIPVMHADAWMDKITDFFQIFVPYVDGQDVRSKEPYRNCVLITAQTLSVNLLARDGAPDRGA